MDSFFTLILVWVKPKACGGKKTKWLNEKGRHAQHPKSCRVSGAIYINSKWTVVFSHSVNLSILLHKVSDPCNIRVGWEHSFGLCIHLMMHTTFLYLYGPHTMILMSLNSPWRRIVLIGDIIECIFIVWARWLWPLHCLVLVARQQSKPEWRINRTSLSETLIILHSCGLSSMSSMLHQMFRMSFLPSAIRSCNESVPEDFLSLDKQF